MAGDVSITFQPPPEHLAKLIERIQSDLRLALPDAVRMAAYYLARSLSASTKASPKKRRLKKRKTGGIAQFPRKQYPHYVDVYDVQGNLRQYYILAGEEKTSKALIIKRSGLAKASWKWMLAALGRAEKAEHAPIKGATSVTKIPDLVNPGWILTNKLGYIESAMKNSGPQAISTAFARAASAGNQALDKKLKRHK